MTKLKVIVLAGGKGTRMQSGIPKVLHTLAAKPLLRHVIDTALSLAPVEIFVVYGAHTPEVREAFSDAPVQWVLQKEPLGTGHAVQQALSHCDDSDVVLVLYGDVPLIQAETLKHLLAQTAEHTLAMLTAVVENPTGFGRVVRDEQQNITEIVEEKEADSTQKSIKEVNTGVLAASAKILKTFLPQVNQKNKQKEYYLTEVIGLVFSEGLSVGGIESQHTLEISGVNDCVQLAILERAYQYAQSQKLARAGVVIRDLNRVDIRGTVHISAGVSLDINVLMEGEVSIGAGSSIGPNVILKNAQIGENVTILANSIVEGACIGNAVRIGPFARIRPESTIADSAEIGNFVELKKAQVGKASKINHLAYVGNVVIDTGVNVGAGVVFCNYNGENKFYSSVEKGAFIGSNSTLVSPVKVGSGATIGAGSVISRDAPAEKLTLSRSKQYTLDRWFAVERQKGLDSGK